MALMGHGTLNSAKYFFLLNYLINGIQKKSKNSSKNQYNHQRQIFKILNLIVPIVICNEVLLAWFKFQAKIPSCSGDRCGRQSCKMRQLFYDKMQQKFITKCVRYFITNCDSTRASSC